MLNFIVLGLIPGTSVQLTFTDVLFIYLLIFTGIWLAMENRFVGKAVHTALQFVYRSYPVVIKNLSTTLSRLV